MYHVPGWLVSTLRWLLSKSPCAISLALSWCIDLVGTVTVHPGLDTIMEGVDQEWCVQVHYALCGRGHFQKDRAAHLQMMVLETRALRLCHAELSRDCLAMRSVLDV